MSGASIDPLLLSDIEQSIHWASLCFESDDINCDGVLHDLLQSQQLLELIKIQQNEEKYISLQSTLSVLIEQVSLRCESRRLKTITTTTTTTTTTSSSSSGVDTAPENEQGMVDDHPPVSLAVVPMESVSLIYVYIRMLTRVNPNINIRDTDSIGTTLVVTLYCRLNTASSLHLYGP